MNLLDRILGRKQARRRQKVLLWPTWREGVAQWQIENLQALVDDGYEANAVVYAALLYKARAFSSVPLLAYDDDDELLPPDDPLSQLLARPHPHFTWLEMSALLSVYYNLFGEAYIYGLRHSKAELPQKLYALRPDRVRHLYRDQKLVGYEYIPAGYSFGSGMPMLAEDVMHVAIPNPGDPFEGFGKGFAPLLAARKSIDVDNAASDFLKLFFDNGALPAGVLQFDVPLDDATVAIAQERWAEIYGGYQRWVEPAVLDSGGKYQRIGLSIGELDMSTLDARGQSRITMVLGVPISLLEMRPGVTQSTYSNMEQARQMFWEDTMSWELRAFETEWQYFLGGPWGTVKHTLTDVPALRATQTARAELLMRAFVDSLVDTDEVRAALGLPADPRGARFMYKMGAQLLPATAEVAPPSAPPSALQQETGTNVIEDELEERAALPAPEVKDDASPFAFKSAVAKQIDQTATSYEPQARAAIRQAFEDDRRALLAILSEHKAAAYAERKSVVWQLVLLDALAWVRGAGKDNWRDLLIPVLQGVIIEQGTQLNAAYGMAFNVRNLLAEDWFQEYELTFTDPITATTEQALSDIFMTALAEGYSIPDTEKALQTLFEQWIMGDKTDPLDRYFATRRLPPWRLEIIARTETIRASNAGSWQLYKNWGTEMKEWWSTNDDRTRDSHRVGAAVGAEALVVGIDEPFMIGGSPMQYPGDPGAPVGETANCRCTVLPVI